jgi:putative transposase
MKKRYSEEQIIGFLRDGEAGVAVKDLCRKHGFSEASYYLWKSKFGGMTVSDAKRLKALEAENARLKKLLAESMLENEVAREALRMAQLSGSVLRYERRADRNQVLRTRIVDMAHRHRRYGRKLPRQVDSSKLEFPRRASARGTVLAAGFPARRAA